MIQITFPSYEVAILAKEVGMRFVSIAYFVIETKEFRYPRPYDNVSMEYDESSIEPMTNNQSDFYVLIPMYEQVMEWLDNNNINVHDYWLSDEKLYGADLYNKMTGHLMYSSVIELTEGVRGYKSRYEALDAAFIKAFELIKLDKSINGN